MSDQKVTIMSKQHLEKLQEEKKQEQSDEKIQNDTESVVTPWAVQGKVDYIKLTKRFGTSVIDGKLIERWEKVTGCKAHKFKFIRRGIVFSNQDIDKILDCVEQGIPIFIYTGRGPSSESMHLGHMVPFMLTRYLQEALNCITVIQMSDDEKFLFKDGTKPLDLEHYRKLSYKNAQDIIACGFAPEKTLIFSNLESNKGDLYFNNVLIENATTMNQIKGTYGLGESLPQTALDILARELEQEESKEVKDQDSDKVNVLKGTIKKFSGESASVGQCGWPARQCGPAFATSFRELFIKAIKHALKEKGDKMPENVAKNLKKQLGNLIKLGNNVEIMCLVPMAIDQAPYFRMARDVAGNLQSPKPAVIHSEFLPGLKQSNGKMSSTDDGQNSTLFLDQDPDKIKKIIKSHAFSGGGETMEEHKKKGGDHRIDISFQYMTYFMDDDEKLKDIAQQFADGTIGSGQLKEITAGLVSDLIREHQAKKALVTDDIVQQFFDATRTLDVGGCYDVNKSDFNQGYTDYDNYGINFDRTFDIVPKSERSGEQSIKITA